MSAAPAIDQFEFYNVDQVSLDTEPPECQWTQSRPTPRISRTRSARNNCFDPPPQVFDFLLSIDVRPIVELSFMPKSFVTCGYGTPRPCEYAFDDPGSYKGLIMPPDDFDNWSALRGVCAHLNGMHVTRCDGQA